jgi:hypothetical protein
MERVPAVERRPADHRRLTVVVLAVAIGLAGGVAPGPLGQLGPLAPPDAAALSAWTGRVDLYRAGTFTTQASWLWCTAAGVQIARNIVRRETDHSAASQRRYFDWMRARNHYTIPVSDGVDPAGWAAGLAHFVDARYRVVASTSFGDALRSAVRRLRQTGRPVALLVDHGNHGWLLTGFSATADPAVTRSYVVTSVRVVGPLFGLQSRGGYDMAPGTQLSPTRLATFLTPWHYPRTRMMWEGRWVTIQPVPTS